MKIEQIAFASKGVVEVRSADLNEKLNPNDILIQTACTMISPGTELAALHGTHSKSGLQKPPAWLTFPSVPGYLAAGTVIDKGSEVRNLKVGDRVSAEGAGVWNSHSSHLIMNAGDYKAVSVATGVSFEEAVFTKMGSIAMTGVRVLHPQFGDSVAVMGLGLVGQITAQLSVLAGAGSVVTVDPVEQRRRIASAFRGITAISPDDPVLNSAVVAGDRTSGFDHVIEASGNASAFLKACEIARIRGRIAVLSSPHKPVEIRLYDHIHSKGLQILGAHGFVLASSPDVNDTWTDARQRRFFMNLMAEKRVNVGSLLTHKVGHEQAPEMYRGFAERPCDFLGVIFYWNKYQGQN